MAKQVVLVDCDRKKTCLTRRQDSFALFRSFTVTVCSGSRQCCSLHWRPSRSISRCRHDSSFSFIPFHFTLYHVHSSFDFQSIVATMRHVVRNHHFASLVSP